MFEISQLLIYPVKSLGGISLDTTNVVQTGFQHDRSWMIVDKDGKFITQREFPKLNLVQAKWVNGKFEFSYSDTTPSLILDPEAELNEKITTEIWGFNVESLLENKSKNEWISEYLGIRAMIVRMPVDGREKVTPVYKKTIRAQFSDGYPIHLVNTKSVIDLSHRTDMSLSYHRFRPNIVVDLPEAYMEDTIQQVTLNQIRFECIKPCGRCVMITIPPNQKSIHKEPLKTLSEYRKEGNSVNFGIYLNPILNPESENSLRVSDKLLFTT